MDVRAGLVVAHRLEEEVEPQQERPERDEAERAEVQPRLGGDGAGEQAPPERRLRARRGEQPGGQPPQPLPPQVHRDGEEDEQRGAEPQLRHDRPEPLGAQVRVVVGGEAVQPLLDRGVRGEGERRGRERQEQGEEDGRGDREPRRRVGLAAGPAAGLLCV